MSIKNVLIYAIILIMIWLVLSGIIDVSIILLGLISVALTLFIIIKAFKIFNFKIFDDLNIINLLWFLPKLLIEIIKSNFHMLKTIVTRQVNSQLILIKNTTTTDIGEYILAMSITLTPGSLIVEYNKNELLVHVIDSETKLSISSLYLNKLVENIEKKHLKTNK